MLTNNAIKMYIARERLEPGFSATVPNWLLCSNRFGHTENAAKVLCLALGLDPLGKDTSFEVMRKHISEAGSATI